LSSHLAAAFDARESMAGRDAMEPMHGSRWPAVNRRHPPAS
jgi:hypothetical protein